MLASRVLPLATMQQSARRLVDEFRPPEQANHCGADPPASYPVCSWTRSSTVHSGASESWLETARVGEYALKDAVTTATDCLARQGPDPQSRRRQVYTPSSPDAMGPWKELVVDAANCAVPQNSIAQDGRGLPRIEQPPASRTNCSASARVYEEGPAAHSGYRLHSGGPRRYARMSIDVGTRENRRRRIIRAVLIPRSGYHVASTLAISRNSATPKGAGELIRGTTPAYANIRTGRQLRVRPQWPSFKALVRVFLPIGGVAGSGVKAIRCNGAKPNAALT
jgi:hypothetical protein